ncbi:ATP-binding protein [Aquabacterium humicola]|uniref:ATP-binding protein n=1 Tax=Aquabacterium humicola TaxID=3237377 RepID=UPI002543E7E9|nr:ATP-binding protein [Rubrivivax pictus]
MIRARLGPRLLAAIVLASTCLALIATAVQLYLEYSRDLTEIETQFRQIEASYIDSLSRSLWSFDRQQTQVQLEGLVKMRDVQHASVRDSAGEVQSVGPPQGARRLQRSYPLHSPDAMRRPIGTLTVGVGLDGVYARLVDRLLVIATTQAIKTFFVALFILYIVSAWVTRHLDHLSSHARALTVDRLTQPLVLRRGKRHKADELDDVAAALNDTSRALAVEIDRRVHAEQGSRAKSAVLANVSHELRTPLNAILGYAQLLQMGDRLDAHQRQQVATIQSSGEHLLALITDLLDLARIEAGKLDLEPSVVPLRELLHRVADIVRVRAEDKGLQFVVDADPALPRTVMADDRALRQVLLNLASNAVKFTDRGSVRLSLRRDGDGAPIRFMVEDTGIGMDEAQLQRLFRPFEQLGNRERRAGGTGLGLAISAELVRAMGGEIRVESRLGAGSRFWFALALPVVDARPIDAAPAHDIAAYEGDRRRILVVDDLPQNRTLLVEMLAPIGFAVSEAANGDEALQRMQSATPDLVLMDMEMPGLDGLQATRFIRGHATWGATPIIAVSASNIPREDCLAAGANAFLTKPLDRDSLLEEIGACLDLRWRAAAA